jgi:ferrous iron transport protein B
MAKSATEVLVPLRMPLFRGAKHLRIALVGLPNSGKSTLFKAVSSTNVQTGELAGTHRAYEECAVQIGLDEARLVDLPSIHSLHHDVSRPVQSPWNFSPPRLLYVSVVL